MSGGSCAAVSLGLLALSGQSPPGARGCTNARAARHLARRAAAISIVVASFGWASVPPNWPLGEQLGQGGRGARRRGRRLRGSGSGSGGGSGSGSGSGSGNDSGGGGGRGNSGGSGSGSDSGPATAAAAAARWQLQRQWQRQRQWRRCWQRQRDRQRRRRRQWRGDAATHDAMGARAAAAMGGYHSTEPCTVPAPPTDSHA